MSQSVKCPSCNEQSTETDFCSHCGFEIQSAAPAASPASTPASSGTSSPPASGPVEHCPKCTAERDDPGSPFCGTCGYNFVTKQGGDAVIPEPTPAPSTVAPVTSAPVAVVGSGSGPRMDVVITVDFAAVTAPKVRPSLTFPLFDEESLIGRKNSALKQTLAIEDDAVSKRHALIVRRADGSFIIRDLGSTNGTKVNGTSLVAGADHPLKEGDIITMGEFTIITVQAIRNA